MATLYREREARARRNRRTHIAFYRHELQRLADRRGSSLAAADQATAHIQRLLPLALQAGISVGEAVALTGVSRATIYRMVSEARHEQDLRGLTIQFERTLETLEQELGVPPLPADLQRRLGGSLDEIFSMLMQLYGPLAAEASALGPMALTVLGDLIPGLGTPEKIVLNMLMFQGMRVDDVARSTQLPETQVLGWAALALLRTLPELRTRCSKQA